MHDMTIQRTEPQSIYEHVPHQTLQFYLRAMDILDQSKIRYLVGGAYSLAFYTGIVRHTKDFDVFIRAEDVKAALAIFEQQGYPTEYTHPHWVAKAFNRAGDDPDFVDFIYGSGNGLTAVDDQWFENAVPGEIFGRPVRLCPVEEIIWSKSFIMERNRFDGADVIHLLLSRGDQLNWPRLLQRFAGCERVLLAHLLLFGFAFPVDKTRVPQRVIDELQEKIKNEPPTRQPLCRGTILSWNQYLPDIHDRGYLDARLGPDGPLTQDQINRWTKAIK